MRLRHEMHRHLDELSLAAYLEGTLDGRALERTEGHLAHCGDCRRSVAALRDLPPLATVPPELLARAKAVPGATSRRRLPIAAAAAAVLVLATLLVARQLRGPVPAAGLFRATPAGALQALAPAAGELVRGPEVRFRWSAQPDADRYVVVVFDAAGTTLATLEAWPPTTAAAWRLPAGGRPATALWRVRALRGDRTVAETRPLVFRLR